MANTEEIIKEARALGKLIAGHEASERYAAALSKLREDTEAQRDLTDFNRHAAEVQEKQAKGEPIEVEDKRKLETLRDAMIKNPVLGSFQMAQMDYLDLMRKVDAAISGEHGGGAGGAGSPGGVGVELPKG